MLENYPLLEKSRVKAHQRRTKSGKVTQVSEHEVNGHKGFHHKDIQNKTEQMTSKERVQYHSRSRDGHRQRAEDLWNKDRHVANWHDAQADAHHVMTNPRNHDRQPQGGNKDKVHYASWDVNTHKELSKQVGKSLENYPMLKSRVKAHQRRTKSGKIVDVKEHQDSRTKKEAEKKGRAYSDKYMQLKERVKKKREHEQTKKDENLKKPADINYAKHEVAGSMGYHHDRVKDTLNTKGHEQSKDYHMDKHEENNKSAMEARAKGKHNLALHHSAKSEWHKAQADAHKVMTNYDYHMGEVIPHKDQEKIDHAKNDYDTHRRVIRDSIESQTDSDKTKAGKIQQMMAKERSMKSLENYPMLKSRVKAHQRRTKSGKVVSVKEHQDSRQKKSPFDHAKYSFYNKKAEDFWKNNNKENRKKALEGAIPSINAKDWSNDNYENLTPMIRGKLYHYLEAQTPKDTMQADEKAVFDDEHKNRPGTPKDTMQGKKLKTVSESYSWGNLIKVESGNKWKAILHPENIESVRKLKAGESYSFKDEQKMDWKVTATSEDGNYNIEGKGGGKKGHFEIKDKSIKEPKYEPNEQARKSWGKWRTANPSKAEGKSLEKSLKFKKTGKDINEGIAKRIMELEKKIAVREVKLAKTPPQDKLADKYEVEHDVPQTETDPLKDWQIKNWKQNIQDFELLCKNLKEKQTYELQEHELKRYFGEAS